MIPNKIVFVDRVYKMVNLSERLVEITKLVDAGKYFTINRARQYGKTTTLVASAKGNDSRSYKAECTGMNGTVLIMVKKLW